MIDISKLVDAAAGLQWELKAAAGGSTSSYDMTVYCRPERKPKGNTVTRHSYSTDGEKVHTTLVASQSYRGWYQACPIFEARNIDHGQLQRVVDMATTACTEYHKDHPRDEQ